MEDPEPKNSRSDSHGHLPALLLTSVMAPTATNPSVLLSCPFPTAAGAFQAQPESPGNKPGLEKPDAISSVRRQVPPGSLAEGMAPSCPLPWECSQHQGNPGSLKPGDSQR